MKISLLIPALLISIVLLGCFVLKAGGITVPAQMIGGEVVQVIDTDQLKRVLEGGQLTANRDDNDNPTSIDTASFVVVDVRSKREIEVSMIPGAITRDQYERDMADYLGKTVIAYCTVGVRSGVYARSLAAKGVQALNYRGSILKWVDAELPLVTPEGIATNRVHTYSRFYQVPAAYEQVTR